MAQLEFNEDVARQIEIVYSSRDVLRRRSLIHDALAARPGERILDVGCGPGFYVSELLDRVGADGSLVAVDGSSAMLGLAAHRNEGRPNVTFHEADATSLPVEDESFDAALSVQVLEYVEDVDAALAEIHRAVKPGGRVLIWDVDWGTLSWHAEDHERMERMQRAWDEHLADPALPRTLAPRLRTAGFTDVVAEGHTFATTELIPDAYGGALTPLIAQYVVEGGSIPEDEARAWEAEQRRLDERGEFYVACVQFCFTAIRG